MKHYIYITPSVLTHIKHKKYQLPFSMIDKKLKSIKKDDYIITINLSTSNCKKYKVKQFIGDNIILSFKMEYPTYEIGVKGIWYEYIKNKKKLIEGRLNKGKFKVMNVGNYLLINNNESKTVAKITSKREYESFSDMLKSEGLDVVLPGIKSINDGVDIYREFYTEGAEKKYGVVAFGIKVIKAVLL